MTSLNLHAATLRISVQVAPPLLFVELCGELDLACTDLPQTITTLQLEQVDTVIIDLGQLSFVDVAGARAVLQVRHEQSAEGREVYLINAQRLVRRVFTLLGHAHCLAA